MDQRLSLPIPALLLLFHLSVMSDSLRPHERFPGSSGIFPGKSTKGVAIPSPGDLPDQGSDPRLLLSRQILYHWGTWKAIPALSLPYLSLVFSPSV